MQKRKQHKTNTERPGQAEIGQFSWDDYCGFYALDTDGFISLQRTLLENHLTRIAGSRSARELFDAVPTTYDEFLKNRAVNEV